MPSKTWLYVLFICLTLFSCELERGLNFDSIQSEPQPYVICVWGDDRPMLIYTDWSIPLGFNHTTPTEQDSIIPQVYKNDTILDTRLFPSTKNTWLQKNRETIELGKSYHLRATCTGCKMIFSEEVRSPHYARIDSSHTDFDQEKGWKTEIFFKNQKAGAHYSFSLAFLKQDGTAIKDAPLFPNSGERLPPAAIEPTDTLGPYLTFERHEIFPPSNSNEISGYRIYLYSLSEELVKFRESLSFYDFTATDFFNQTVPVYSNIQNGLGFFGIYRADSLDVIF